MYFKSWQFSWTPISGSCQWELACWYWPYLFLILAIHYIYYYNFPVASRIFKGGTHVLKHLGKMWPHMKWIYQHNRLGYQNYNLFTFLIIFYRYWWSRQFPIKTVWLLNHIKFNMHKWKYPQFVFSFYYHALQ